jgi:nucleoside-diphosphate-sugar epimerase
MSENNPTLKRVLVTGSSGGIGRYVVRELLDHGYEVTGADQKPGPDRDWNVRTYLADMEDMGQVINIMHGHDAVVHLAAIPSPTVHAPEVVFRLNMMSTFNVLQAATVLGIKKVVIASSLSALGTAYHFRLFSPEYIPFDEDHPLMSQDAYGLSKQLGEDLAVGFVRRTPDMSITSLRFTWVVRPEDREWAKRLMNQEDSPGRKMHFSSSFWTYVDVRDAALSCRLSVERTVPGHEAYYIIAPETYMEVDSVDLLKKYYQDVKTYKPGFGGRMSPADPTRAAEVLGFKARYGVDGEPLG